MLRKLFLTMSVLAIFAVAAYAQGGTTATPSSSPSTETTKPKRPPIFRPNKDQIMQVQKILKDKKLYNGEANGKYNDETRAGISSFQKDSGLRETGTLNRATLEKFGVELTDKQKLIPVTASSTTSLPDKTSKTTSTKMTTASTASATSDGPKKPAPFRANADQIKAAQKILKDGKMYAGDETGKLDDLTRDGLKKYQEANGVKVTGTLNAITLGKMGIALTDAQKANVTAQAAYDAAHSN